MGYGSQRENSGGTAALIVVVVLLLGLLVIGGGGAMLFFRARAVQQQAMMERDRALVAMKQAEADAAKEAAAAEQAAAEQAAAQAAAGAAAPSPAPVVLSLDERGNLQADGAPLPVADLPAWLAKTCDGADGEFSVLLRVHPRCAYQHVAVVLDACSEAQVPCQMKTGEESPRAESGSDVQPTSP